MFRRFDAFELGMLMVTAAVCIIFIIITIASVVQGK
jgi:hypothetical protein